MGLLEGKNQLDLLSVTLSQEPFFSIKPLGWEMFGQININNGMKLKAQII